MLKANQKPYITRWSITLPNSFKRNVVISLLTLSTTSFAERRLNTANGNSPKQINRPIPKAWEKLLDPKQPEFWREGNHIPDEGFLLWAMDPTIENAKLFLLRMNTKRDILHKMQAQQEIANKDLIKAGLIADDYNFLGSYTPSLHKNKAFLGTKNNTHIFFFFDPRCPHCNEQAQILSGKTNVTPMQVSGNILKNFDGLPPTVWAEKQDIERYLSDKQVPKLVIYNSKTNKMTQIKGVSSLEILHQASETLQKQEVKNGK